MRMHQDQPTLQWRRGNCSEISAMVARDGRHLSPLLFAAVTGSLLAGCAPIGIIDTASVHYRLPAETTIVIRQVLRIPPGTAHVTLQDGRLVTNEELRRYEPFCELEVNDVLQTEQQVRPGRFAVTQVIRLQKKYGKQGEPVRLAANTATAAPGATASAIMLLAAHDDSYWLNEVRLRLRSAEQANVRELRCAGGWALISDVAYPTLAEMKHALGSLVAIDTN